MAEPPKRKHPRLKNYDYAKTGAYFVTFCTKDRKNILSTVGRGALAPPLVTLTPCGKIVDELIQKIPLVYSRTFLEHYVIMPNHVHLLLRLERGHGGAGAPRPTVSAIVGGIKSLSTRKIGTTIWQPSFYDHVIRDDNDFLRIWTYINTNPAKWAEDRYYTEDTP